MLTILTCGIGIMFIAIGCYQFYKSHDSKSSCPQIPLMLLSQIWRPVPAHKETVTFPTELPLVSPTFNQLEISDFYSEIIGRYPCLSKNTPYNAVISRVLEILDVLGDCPSLVRTRKKCDDSKSRYDLLERIPLWQHSLNVSRHMLKKAEYDALTPTLAIIGLGHDLGKIPVFRDKVYLTGDHPFYSAVCLSGIPAFRQINEHKSILKVVQNHHYPSSSDFFAKILKECDALARSDELASQMLIEAKQEGMRESKPKLKVIDEKDTALMLGIEQCNYNDYIPSRVEISSWFRPQALLDEIKAVVNTVTASKWIAVSMPSGHIYIGLNKLWKLLNRVHPHTPDILASYANKKSKADIVYSVCMELHENHDALATELMAPGEYLCPVTIFSGAGKEIKIEGSQIRLIPLRARTFNLDVMELEREKSWTIRSMVSVIRPVQRKKDLGNRP